MFSKGDKVSVLDEAINGIVLSVQNNEISIETEDGFVMKFTSKELIKVQNTNDLKSITRNVDFNKIKNLFSNMK